MAVTYNIIGRYVELKSATVDDADFTLKIRQDPSLNEFIPNIEGTVEQQKDWIAKQRLSDDDYFFVIWDKNCERIGTIGLYNCDGDKCEAGRLIVNGNAFQSMESQMLSYDFAFETLKMKLGCSYIYKENSRAIRFSQTFGGDFDYEVAYDHSGRAMVKITNYPEAYYPKREQVVKMLYRVAQRS